MKQKRYSIPEQNVPPQIFIGPLVYLPMYIGSLDMFNAYESHLPRIFFETFRSSLESLVHHAELALISGNGPDDLDESLTFLEAELHLGDF